MKQPFFTRYGTLILLASVFLLPFAVLGTARAIKTNKNDVKQWLPETYEETQVYRQFRQRFEGEEFILVTWEGCTLDDPRLQLLCNKLVPPLGVSRGSDEPAYFSKVITGKSVLEILTHEPLNLAPEEALKRLTVRSIGADGKQTCAVLTLTMTGKQTPAHNGQRAARHCGQRMQHPARRPPHGWPAGRQRGHRRGRREQPGSPGADVGPDRHLHLVALLEKPATGRHGDRGGRLHDAH